MKQKDFLVENLGDNNYLPPYNSPMSSIPLHTEEFFTITPSATVQILKTRSYSVLKGLLPIKRYTLTHQILTLV